MATLTTGPTAGSTSNTNSYSTGAATPAAGDLIVAFVVASATVAAGGFSSSAGLTFTKVCSFTKAVGADTLYCFVADSFATATSQSYTFTCTGDNATGCIIITSRIAGMSRTGLNAIRQFQGQSDQTGGVPPAPVFDTAALTDNLCMGLVGNASAPAGMTIPSGWTGEMYDSNITSPTMGAEGCYRNSGFTGTTVTWGNNSATDFGSIIVELDTSIIDTWLERWRGVKRPRATYRRM